MLIHPGQGIYFIQHLIYIGKTEIILGMGLAGKDYLYRAVFFGHLQLFFHILKYQAWPFIGGYPPGPADGKNIPAQAPFIQERTELPLVILMRLPEILAEIFVIL